MSLYLLVYQKASPVGEKRFREYLSRKKWFRYTAGVYWSHNDGKLDKEAMWTHCQKEFGFDPTQDFFGIFDCADGFRGGNAHFYRSKAPPWPGEDPCGHCD